MADALWVSEEVRYRQCFEQRAAESGGREGRVGGVGVEELMLLGARVVRSIVHVAGRVIVVGGRQVAVVVSGEGGVGWCDNCFADLPWSLHGGTQQRAQVPSDE